MRWVVAVTVVLALAAPALAQTATHIPGTPAVNLGAFDTADFGYVIEEHFISGEATSYVPAGELTTDGRWTVKEGGKAAYTTQVITIRPKDASKFSGTVLVEWFTTGGGGVSAPDWGLLHREIMRKGHAYVGVTTQRVGVYGNTGGQSQSQPLKKADPVRYEKLEHPGDAFAYDIFTQAGKAARDGKLLGGLKPKKLLVTCSTVTTGYLVTYVNAIDPLAKVFDGFFIRSRTATGQRLGPDLPAMPSPAPFRSDLRAPVLSMITESDLLISSYYRARVPDNDKLRVWEVAGTSHGDAFVFTMTFKDNGKLPIEELAKGYAPLHKAMGAEFPKPMNAAPQHHYIAWAAIDALNRWVTAGKAPPKAPLLDMTTEDSVGFKVDAHNNVTGGVRSPWMDVPTKRLTGQTELASGIGRNYGMTEDFDSAKLKQLYPGGKTEYLRKFNAALDRTVAAGFILKVDVPEIRALAATMYPEN